ncbi:MAG: PAS domain S-box protein [Planctomycetes bacterium]|nr:PAS domain S-box protein [Planctomycetota bacterium]
MLRIRNIPIRSQIALGMVLPVLAGILCASGMLICAFQSFHMDDLHRRMHQRGAQTAREVDGYLDSLAGNLNLLARVRGLADMSRNDMATWLDALIASNSAYHAAAIVAADGKTLCQVWAAGREGTGLGDVTTRPAFLAAVIGKSDYISFSQSAPASGKKTIIFAVPVRDKKDQVAGMLLAEADLKYLNYIISGVRIGATGYAYLLDKKGWLIEGRPDLQVPPGFRPDLADEFFDMSPQAKAQPHIYHGLTNQDVTGAAARAEKTDWLVIVEQPTEEAFQYARRLILAALLCMAGMCLIAGGISMLISGRLMHPLKQLTDASRSIIWGDLDVHVDCGGGPEPKLLANTFNTMIASTRELIDALRSSSDNLAVTLNSIGDAVLVVDEDGLVARMNPVAEQLTGWKLSEAAGRGVNDVFRIIDGKTRQPPEVNPVEKALKEGMVASLAGDAVLLSRGGGEIPIADSAAPMRGKDGEVTGAVLVFHEVTEARKAEQALRRSEEKFRAIANYTYDWETWISPEGKLLWVNPAVQRVTGYSPDECLAMPDYPIPLIHPDDRRKIQKFFSEAVAGTEGRNIEFRITRKDGQIIWCAVSWRPIYDEHGRRLGHRANVRVITERKKAQDAARLDELRMKALVDLNQLLSTSTKEIIDFAMEQGVRLTNSTIGCVAFTSPDETMLTMFSWSRQVMEECRISDKSLEHPVKTAGLLGEAVRQRKAIITNDYESPSPLKKGCPEGHIALKRHMSVPIFDGQHIVAVAGVGNKAEPYDESDVRQLTLLMDGMWRLIQRRKTEDELARLARGVEHAADAIMIADKNGVIQYVNPAFEKITGYSRDEAIGKNPRFLKSGRHDEFFYQEMWLTLNAGNVWNGRIINRRKDGKLFEENATISPIRDASGQIVSYVAVKHDVTEQIELENQLRQAQKMDAVGRLAGGIAHDFNNQLTVINGYCELLLGGMGAGDPQQSLIQEIMHAAERSATLTNQLLAFSRKQILHPVVMDFNRVLEEFKGPLARLIGEDVSLEIRTASTPAYVRADRGLFEQALMNLVVNARDAMPEGGSLLIETSGVTLDEAYCAANLGVRPGKYVLTGITDTGVGMDKDTLRKIFEPFFTTKPLGKGTGLGLAMVYGFVKQSDGHIAVSSEPGRGTTVKIFLPLAAPEDAPDVAAGDDRQSGKYGETILFVEDEDAVRELVTRILRSRGYRVMEAANPRKAIPLAEQFDGKIDLLVTDMVMPEMSGRKMADVLKASRPDMKILYITGYTDLAEIQDRDNASPCHLLRKPFSPDELARAIRNAIES